MSALIERAQSTIWDLYSGLLPKHRWRRGPSAPLQALLKALAHHKPRFQAPTAFPPTLYDYSHCCVIATIVFVLTTRTLPPYASTVEILRACEPQRWTCANTHLPPTCREYYMLAPFSHRSQRPEACGSWPKLPKILFPKLGEIM